jgi:hypothetical protein
MDRPHRAPHPGERLRAAGTFIASASAFVAASLLLSHVPSTIPRAVAIGFWWLFGVTLQIAAGLLAPPHRRSGHRIMTERILLWPS